MEGRRKKRNGKRDEEKKEGSFFQRLGRGKQNVVYLPGEM